MILLVPIRPEVPPFHRPSWSPALATMVVMTLIFIAVAPIIQRDVQYIDSFRQAQAMGELPSPEATNARLRGRPLLSISISPRSWDLERLFYSNFIHGSFFHLALNLIGVGAGLRLCSTFMPFLCSFAIFIFGGSLGLLSSTLLSQDPAGAYIPHVGASGGIFALMGAYYIYNFRYRTTYFFWFPSKNGLISLRTSWFFFIDVLLVELLLSAAQFFPQRIDSVDHLAHVAGFAVGLGLAIAIRTVQGWPDFLQTRGEFLYWSSFLKPSFRHRGFDPVRDPFGTFLELLEINAYNDLIKLRLYRHATRHINAMTDEELDEALAHLTPTFMRVHPKSVAAFLRKVIKADRGLSEAWLRKVPYDCIIHLSRELATPESEQHLLYKFVIAYRKTHAGKARFDRKLTQLIGKLEKALSNEKRDSA